VHVSKEELLRRAREDFEAPLTAVEEEDPDLAAQLRPHRDVFLRFLLNGPDTVARLHNVPVRQADQLNTLFPQRWLREHGTIVRELVPGQQTKTIKRVGYKKYKPFWVRIQAEIFMQFQRDHLAVEQYMD
jgi:hypothetical protein